MGSTELKKCFFAKCLSYVSAALERKIHKKSTPTSHQTYKLSQYLYALNIFCKHYENKSSFWQNLPKKSVFNSI